MLFLASRQLKQVVVGVCFISATIAEAQTLEQRSLARPPEQATPASPDAAKSDKLLLPKETSLQVETSRYYPMKAGEAIEVRLIHPIYCNGRLAVPLNTPLHGRVVSLQPDSQARLRARLRGDFTPFHTERVQFDELLLPSGPVAISSTEAANGAPVLHLTAPGVSPKQSFIARRWSQAKSNIHDRIAYFTAPGLGDRALQLLYHQLPYHPERIDAYTAWSFELTAPLDLLATSGTSPNSPQPSTAATTKPEVWAVNATLSNGLTSATAKPGDPVEALVVEPVYDRDKQLVVPQGSRLVGKVSVAEAAKSFGRNGKLRFTFQQVRFPEGFHREVQGSLAGAATEKTQDLTLDAEGTITPRNKSSVIAPLVLTLLAGRALDTDGNITSQTAVASNGFGLVGRIVGIAAGNRNLAAGLGYYAASLSIYDNFIRSGRDVVFPRDTRIEIETTPLRAPVLKPEGQ
jgi:hypothetical protein